MLILANFCKTGQTRSEKKKEIRDRIFNGKRARKPLSQAEELVVVVTFLSDKDWANHR